MKAITAKWIEKAENDYHVAHHSFQGGPLPADVICFHVQQCIEKYAKAFLQEHGIPVEYADSKMASLLLECASVDPGFESCANDFEQLDQFGIETLYPGRWASQQDVHEASAILERVRPFIRSKLSLE